MGPNYEPIAWAEELIEPARAVDHPRLAFLYVIASQCCMTGRIEAAVGYSDAGQIVLGRSRDAVPYGIEAVLGAVYLVIGQPERWVEWCRAQLARRRDTHVAHPGIAGRRTDSRRFRWGGDGLRGWPHRGCGGNRQPVLCSRSRSSAYGLAFRDADPDGALDALRPGSGDRSRQRQPLPRVTPGGVLADLEAEHGDPLAAFDHVTLAIRNFHNAGNTTTIRARSPILAALFDRLGRHEPAATIAGFAVSPLTAAASPRSPPRSPTCAMSSARRPTNRSPARVRR